MTRENMALDYPFFHSFPLTTTCLSEYIKEQAHYLGLDCGSTD
jgi:hypothetical protein